MFTLADIQPADATELPRNAPPEPRAVIAKEKDAVRRWVALKKLYIKARGGAIGANNKMIPHTTNADVKQLATLWSNEVKKVKARSDDERSEHKRWQACVDKVAKLADASKPDERYSDNEHFWQHCTARLAIYLESRKVVPSEWELFKEAFVESLAEVPSTIGRAGVATAGAVGNAASAVLSKPAMAAMAILGGVLLVPPIIRAVRK
jgi:hypothetical protein